LVQVGLNTNPITSDLVDANNISSHRTQTAATWCCRPPWRV